MPDILLIPVYDEELIKTTCTLAGEIWKEHYIPIIGENQVKYMLEKFQSEEAVSAQINEGYKYYLISYKKSYIGYFSYVLKGNHLFLSKIYVNADFRGMGAGKKVFEFLVNAAKENNLTRMKLTVNKNNINSIKAYEKCGFRIIDVVVQDIGSGFFMDDYLMEKVE